MNRRELLKSILALPAALWLGWKVERYVPPVFKPVPPLPAPVLPSSARVGDRYMDEYGRVFRRCCAITGSHEENAIYFVDGVPAGVPMAERYSGGVPAIWIQTRGQCSIKVG